MSLKISAITGTIVIIIIKDTEILCSIELKPQILKNITSQNLLIKTVYYKQLKMIESKTHFCK